MGRVWAIGEELVLGVGVCRGRVLGRLWVVDRVGLGLGLG